MQSGTPTFTPVGFFFISANATSLVLVFFEFHAASFNAIHSYRNEYTYEIYANPSVVLHADRTHLYTVPGVKIQPARLYESFKSFVQRQKLSKGKKLTTCAFFDLIGVLK